MHPIELPPPGLVPPLPAPDEFAGKVALVTGATAGLGRHLLGALLDLGADVFFCGKPDADGQALAASLGERAHFVPTDLAKVDDCRALVAAAGAFRGCLDYVVNNAAIDPERPLEECDADLLEAVWQVNLRAYYVISREAIPLLERGSGKAIVNIGTTNVLHGWAGAGVYNAAKAGILGFSRSLAREVGPRGIRINVVSPGWIMTERQLAEKVRPADAATLLERQSLKHLLTEEYVTPVTLFLLSRAAAGMTGQNLVVDGGFYLQ